MPTGNPVPQAEVQAALLLLARLGITPQQLLGASFVSGDSTPTLPTFDDYVGRLSQAVTPGTLRVYETYWNRLRAVWGRRRIDEPTPLEIKELAESTKASIVVRRNTRGGRSAAEHMISALRCLYRHAVDDGLILEQDNPAMRVAKPRRLASTRRALLNHQLELINSVTAATGNDPELDMLLVRLHTETACRRGGALALRPFDLDREGCLIRLREKGETERWQPVSRTLMQHLANHTDERGDAADVLGPLLRYRTGNPITARRYDYLWGRLGRHLPWVATQQISTHWLRYTTLTWVERNFGYAIARAYAGHNGRRDSGTTATYVRAEVYEVALALSALTGDQHPLVTNENVERAAGLYVNLLGNEGPQQVSDDYGP